MVAGGQAMRHRCTTLLCMRATARRRPPHLAAAGRKGIEFGACQQRVCCARGRRSHSALARPPRRGVVALAPGGGVAGADGLRLQRARRTGGQEGARAGSQRGYNASMPNSATQGLQGASGGRSGCRGCPKQASPPFHPSHPPHPAPPTCSRFCFVMTMELFCRARCEGWQ